MATRDMTERQFREACARHGFKPAGFPGCWDVGGGRSVSVLNAGPNRRERLAHLVAEAAKGEARR